MLSESNETLKPCPHCKGSANLDLRAYRSNFHMPSHRVLCRLCGLEGPKMPTRDTAREAWDALPREPSPPVQGSRGEQEDGSRGLPFDRDALGRFVREAWVRWAKQQPNPKPNWLADYDELDEADKEADRHIGESVARWTLIGDAARASLANRSAQGSLLEALEELREAGGKAWDEVEDPEAYLYGEEAPPLVWSSERPKAVGKWCVRFKSLSDRELRDWWVIEVDSAQLRQHDWCEKNGIDPHAEFEFAGPFPEPKEEEK